jgi:hypothetical protein
VGLEAVPGGELHPGRAGAGDHVQRRAEPGADRRPEPGGVEAGDRLGLGLDRRHGGRVAPEGDQGQGGDAADPLQLLGDGRVAGGRQEQPARGRRQRQHQRRGPHRARHGRELEQPDRRPEQILVLL